MFFKWVANSHLACNFLPIHETISKHPFFSARSSSGLAWQVLEKGQGSGSQGQAQRSTDWGDMDTKIIIFCAGKDERILNFGGILRLSNFRDTKNTTPIGSVCAKVWKHENHKVGQLDTTFLSISRFLINLEAEEKSNLQKEMNQNLVLTIHFFRFQICF